MIRCLNHSKNIVVQWEDEREGCPLCEAQGHPQVYRLRKLLKRINTVIENSEWNSGVAYFWNTNAEGVDPDEECLVSCGSLQVSEIFIDELIGLTDEHILRILEQDLEDDIEALKTSLRAVKTLQK